MILVYTKHNDIFLKDTITDTVSTCCGYSIEHLLLKLKGASYGWYPAKTTQTIYQEEYE
jgi:hypothetical protein